MSPTTLLRLWRERWGLSEAGARGVPYVVGARQYTWGSGLAGASLWSTRGATSLALLLALPLFAAAVLVPTDLGGQWIFAVVLLAMAFYVRRYMGTLPFLMLVGLTLLAGARYLAWRYDATLPHATWPILGWSLWAMECVAWLWLVLWMCGHLWVVARPSTDLAGDVEDWPYIDVLVVLGGAEMRDARQVLRAACALAWPADRLRVFVQDREGIREWRRDGLEPVPGGARALPAAALPAGNGAFVLRIEAEGPQDQLDDPLLLQQWVVWMQRDPYLALLHGHASALAPPPSPPARALVRDVPGAAVGLLRRSAVEELLHDASVSSLAERLEGRGHRTALMGHARDLPDGGGNPDWLRIDAPRDGEALRRRMRWHATVRALRRPARAAMFAMAAAGLALPLSGVLLIETTLPWFMGYALPYAVLAALAWGRTRAPTRETMPSEARDWALLLILPPITALHAIAAAIRRRRNPQSEHSASVRNPGSAWNALSIAACVVILLAGLSRLHASTPVVRVWLVAASLAIGYVLLLRISKWAVEQEMRTLLAQRDAMRVQPALLYIEGDCLADVDIVDFPDQPLSLRPMRAEQLRIGSVASSDESSVDIVDVPARLYLRDAPDTPLEGRCRQDPTRRIRMLLDRASAERVETLAERLQLEYLKRHYWLPGSRLSSALREAFGARPPSGDSSLRAASARAFDRSRADAGLASNDGQSSWENPAS